MKYGIDLGRQPGKSVFWAVAGRDVDGHTYKQIYIDELADWNASQHATMQKLRHKFKHYATGNPIGSHQWHMTAKQLEHYTREDYLYNLGRLPGKTPTPNFIQQLVEQWADESFRDSQREATEDLRPRWLSVRILQLTGLDAHARSLTTEIAFPRYHGRAAGKTARLKELSDRLPELQLIQAGETRSRILFGRSSEDWRALGRYLAASEGLPEKEAK
jgi:hypothetical protein